MRVFNITYIDMEGNEQTVTVEAINPLDAYRLVPPNQKVVWVGELR